MALWRGLAQFVHIARLELGGKPMNDAAGPHDGGPAQSTTEQQLAGARAACTRAERERRGRDRLLALLLHELRNPLTPIRNAILILRRKLPDDPLAERALEQMDRQSHHLTRLLDEVQDLAFLLQGKLTVCKQAVDVAAAVSQAVAAVRPVLERQQLRLEVSLPPEPLAVQAEPARLVQVVTLVVQAAARHTPAGGSVRLTAGREGTSLVLAVRDTGFGIASDALAHYFDLDTEETALLSGRGGRAGLGLLLARGLAELHGGKLDVSSAGSGQGTEVVVRLPLSAEGVAIPAPADPAAVAAPRAARVLCVDDDPEIAESLAQLLRDLGHEVRAAHSGPEALALLCEYRPEAVLLDITLPGMDGCELARKLRQRPGLEGVLLVAVSGHGDEAQRQRAREAGINEYLVKPVKAAEVERLLQREIR
jgi:signal transduction histidine kinase